MKKGQIQAQVFVYILSMLVIALVLLYGYKSISTMKDRAKQVDFLAFKNDVIKAVEKVSNDYGTVRAPTFNVPTGYKEVCFIDMDDSPADIESEHPLVYEAWNEHPYPSANVFLITDLAKEFFMVGGGDKTILSIDEPNYLCVTVKNNQIKIILEGVGGKAKIKLPE